MSETTAVLDRPTTPPQAYGYMRVPRDVADDKVRNLEKEVIAFAHASGLQFVRFFFEFQCGSRDAFNELVDELVRADVHYVIVPSLRHLAQNFLLQDVMLNHLGFAARAQVLAMRIRTAIE